MELRSRQRVSCPQQLDQRVHGQRLALARVLSLRGLGQDQLEIPEVLGTVSGLTRVSPYVPLPVLTAGSTLSGQDRAKLMKYVCITMQDVKQGEKVGKLAISLCSDDERYKMPLDKKRLYE